MEGYNCEEAIIHETVDLVTGVKKKGRFDADGFYAALDAERRSRRYTWKRVADESRVSASTLTRMAQGRRPDVDSLAAPGRMVRAERGCVRPGRSSEVRG